jgi:RND family efflux transporter MFP subunit
MSVSRQIIVSILIIVVALSGWYTFSHREEIFGGAVALATADSPRGPGGQRGGAGGEGSGRGGTVPVATALVGIETDAPEIRAIGTLTAAKAVTLFPEVTSVVKSVDVQPGAHVAEGQVLIRLNDADEIVAIDRATIALDDARAALDRAERLKKSNNVTEVALSNARTAFRSAEIDLKSAELERAKRIVTAPFAGVIGLILVSRGDLVTTSTVLTTLDDVSRLTVAFDASERFAGKIEIGHPISGTAIGLPGREIDGQVSAIDSRVDPDTRMFKVEATLKEGIEGLKPGMSIRIAADFEGEPHAAVPSLAIQWDRQGSFVWTLKGDKVMRTAIQIIGRRSGIVIVAGEIAPGDEVVVEGLQRMRRGISVRRTNQPSDNARDRAG